MCEGISESLVLDGGLVPIVEYVFGGHAENVISQKEVLIQIDRSLDVDIAAIQMDGLGQRGHDVYLEIIEVKRVIAVRHVEMDRCIPKLHQDHLAAVVIDILKRTLQGDLTGLC